MSNFPILRPQELQAALKISKPTLRKWMLDGCPCVIVSRGRHRVRRRFVLERVLSWLEKREQRPRLGRPHARRGVHA